MSLSGQLEFEVEIKTPGNIFFEIYGSNKEYLPKICSQFIQKIDLLEGEWGQVGCIIMAYYFIDGKATNSKELVEEVDEKNKSITYNIVGGEIMELYKTLRTTIQILLSTNDAEFMKIKLEYEKQNEDVPCPYMLKAFLTAATKAVDAHYSHLLNSGSAQL